MACAAAQLQVCTYPRRHQAIRTVVDVDVEHNPVTDSLLLYIIWVPFREGLSFRAGGTWPRTKAVYCRCAYACGPGGRDTGHGDPGRLTRALRLPVRESAGAHRTARPTGRRLRRGTRWPPGRGRRA